MSGKVIPISKNKKEKGGNRIIFGDYSMVKYQSVVSLLEKDGVQSELFTDIEQFLKRLSEEHFDLCVVSLLWGGTGPGQFIQSILKNTANDQIRIIVVSKQIQRANIENTLHAGADDFIPEPFQNESLYYRILYHLKPKTVVSTFVPSWQDPQANGGLEYNRHHLEMLYEAVEQLSLVKRENMHGCFLKIIQKVAGLLESNRTSLIIVDSGGSMGVVVASSDDPKFFDFPILLEKYPEVLHVVNTGSIVLIEDTTKSVFTQKISEKVKSIEIGSVMVFPVRYAGEVVGVLTVRRAKSSVLPELPILKLVQAISDVCAAHSNTQILLRKIYSEYEKKKTA